MQQRMRTSRVRIAISFEDLYLDSDIAGYDFGKVTRSPMPLSELRELEIALGFTARDREMLARASAVISDNAEALVDGWRATIGAHEFLAKWFFGPDGKPDDHYKAAIKKRFVRWVRANVPEFKVIMIAQNGGLVPSAQGVAVQADYSFEEAPKLDVVMVPGGRGTFTELRNPVLLNYLVRADRDSEFTTSVCTGSALLAKAGLLKGRRATSNKKFFSLAVDQDPSVEWEKSARWVEDGKYLTSSGVSAGTDMALGLLARIYGLEHTRMLARTLEYQWSEDPTNDPFAIK